ncbi:double zinc ribbon domain-containing protein [Haladaptatus salinisoli]|uniref:double zinc ribbon domain-containing protein n=1 Tax=Haladaptatus salinisoli TaxID=2884876 RepID=UPI001D0BB793|nr:zinc ribbon domain-containing protein [Haladaptatus salinisoli]
MSKITFRADDDLVERIESLDASKSEVMREALREYLDGHGDSTGRAEGSLDAALDERVDALIDRRLGGARGGDRAQDINVNVTVEGAGEVRGRESESKGTATPNEAESARRTTADTHQGSNTCGQCGETLDTGHVYCPNCGEKATHRVFCDCGDEIRSDWAFCPGCGRRTPSADVLDSS